MTCRRLCMWNLQALLTLLVGLACTLESEAQKKKPPAGPPLAPVLNMPVPMGVQRGTTIELNLTGTNLSDPLALSTSIPGAKAVIPMDGGNGDDPAKLKVNIEVPKEAPLGFHTLRLLTTRGVSNLRLFCVDDLPQVVKDGKNTSKSTAQAVPVPSVVAGTVAAESTDYYKISAQAGQRLSFEVLGRRLGSAFDPQLSLIDVKTGREVAHSNDAPGLQTDARLIHTFKEGGEYLLELRDVMHRGGGDFVYRLRIGDFPCATTPVPMAIKRGSKASVTFAGPAVENVAAVEVTAPTDPLADTIWVAPKGASGLHGWPVALAVSDLDEVVEQEPNNDIAKANRVPVPGGVTGRFQEKNDKDHYALKLAKGRYLIEAQTLELNSPTDVYMVLKGDKGNDVAKTAPADATKSSRLDFTAPADGEYVLDVEHLHYWGGPSESYRITITPYEPGFDVALASERADAPQGAGAILPISSIIRRDYTGPIELSVVGHPGITGQTVYKGAGGPPQPNVNQAILLLSVAPDVPLGIHPVKVQAKAVIGGKPVVSYANVRVPVVAALGTLPFPPRQLNTEVVVGVTEKPPFTLVVKLDQEDIQKGGTATGTLSAVRAPGFDEEIMLTPVGVPANVTPPAVKSIPKGMNEVKVEFKTAPAVVIGQFPVSFTGRTRHMDKDFAVTAAPANLVVAGPFTLKVEPEKVDVDVGGKTKFKVTATRKGGYAGPITLMLRGLPANVTVGAATIPQGMDAVEIEVMAAANAAPGETGGVNVLGTAPAAGNAQDASNNFVVNVVKK